MDRGDLTLAVAGALTLAVLVGWTLAWIAGRLNARRGDAGPSHELAVRLETAEAARRQAETRLGEVETDLGARLAEVESELAATLRQLDQARVQAEEVRAAYRAARLGDGLSREG